MIRMIVTDLDGTYLRNDKSVSEYTRRITAEVRKRGVLFVVATARPIRSVVERLPYVQFDVGIFHNGAVMRTSEGDIYGAGISEPDVIARRILEGIPGSNISVESEDVLYCNYDSLRVWPGEPYTFTEDFACVQGKTADKLIVEAHSHEEAQRIARYIPDYAYTQLSENRIAMIMNKRATKLNAIRMVAEKYGVAMDEVVAFGDDYNDIEMLKGCGKGIAVANALDEVKAVADEICGSNMEDGEARWMEENILR